MWGGRVECCVTERKRTCARQRACGTLEMQSDVADLQTMHWRFLSVCAPAATSTAATADARRAPYYFRSSGDA